MKLRSSQCFRFASVPLQLLIHYNGSRVHLFCSTCLIKSISCKICLLFLFCCLYIFLDFLLIFGFLPDDVCPSDNKWFTNFTYLLTYLHNHRLPYSRYLLQTWNASNSKKFAAFFTARCTLVQSAVLRSHVVCPSVCPAVCNVGEL